MADVTEDKPVGEAPPAEDVASMFDLSKKKKKKKKESKRSAAPLSAEADNPANYFEGEIAGYQYSELLERIMTQLHEHNPDLAEKKRHTMKPPQVMRVGTKKTLWVNFPEICETMGRNPDHVFQFFMAELGTEGSIDGEQRLVIRGKFVPKYIESLLRRYIAEYVACQMCRSPNTELTRDSVSRLHFVHCKDCGSSRSVAPIRSGFHAVSRADRRAAKNAKA